MEKTPESPTTAQTSDPQTRMSCLVHSQKLRCQFQQMMNILRRTYIIPKMYFNKVSSLICTCRKLSCQEYIDAMIAHTEDMPAEKKLLMSKFTKEEYKPLRANLSQLIEKQPLPSMDSDLIQTAINRLILLLSLALDNDHHLLVYTKNPQPEPEQKYKFQTEIVIRISSDHLKYVFGSSGRHIKVFQKQNDCQLQLVTQHIRDSDVCTLNHMDRVFKLRTTSTTNGQTIENEFRLMVERTVKNRLRHDAMMLKRMRFFKARRQACEDLHTMGTLSNTMQLTAIAAKEKAQENYSNKYQHMLRDRDQRKLDKEHPTSSILEESESWCAHCRLPYSKDIDNAQGACRYHPGYIVFAKANRKAKITKQLYWTCCHGSISGKSTECQKSSHLDNGCAVGQHLWKTHKHVAVTKKRQRQTWNSMKHNATSIPARNMHSIWLDSWTIR